LLPIKTRKEKEHIRWYIEPKGKRTKFTNEVLARELRDSDAFGICAHRCKVIVTGESGLKRGEFRMLWEVPNHEFVERLRGIDGTSFRVFRQVGGGQIEESILEVFRKRRQQKRVRKDRPN